MDSRYKRPDNKNAISILEAAKKDMKFTLAIPVTKEAGATIARNVYESFRMLGDALLIARGIESGDHIMPINELMKTKVQAKRPINVVENLRRLRHNVNYYGYRPSIEEIKDVISIAESCFEPLAKEVEKKIISSRDI